MSVDLAPTDELIKQAAFNKLDPELWNFLTDDDHVVDFQVATRALRSTLQDQLSTYKSDVAAGRRSEDVEWYDRTRALDARVIALLQALSPRVKDCNRRKNDRLARCRYMHLRRAVMAHREATRAGYEPTEEDRLLWMALDEAWSLGA
jgi:hypothetical protein